MAHLNLQSRISTNRIKSWEANFFEIIFPTESSSDFHLRKNPCVIFNKINILIFKEKEKMALEKLSKDLIIGKYLIMKLLSLPSIKQKSQKLK